MKFHTTLASFARHKAANRYLPYSRLIGTAVALALFVWLVIDANVASAAAVQGGAL